MARGFEVTTGLVMQQGLFEENIVAQHRIGTRVQLEDGRVFYYAMAGEALAQGKICISPINNDTIQECAIAAVTTVNGKSVTLTIPTTPVTEANMFEEGWIHARETGAGVGQCVKIKSHPSCLSGDDCVFTLYDPIAIALVTTGTADISMNPFRGVMQDAEEENNPAGIPLIAITDVQYYFWIQTWGIATVLAECASPISTGAPVTLGTVAGTVAPLATATNAIIGGLYPLVGQCYGSDADDLEYTAINLMIYP
jgi:hypothetical protein